MATRANARTLYQYELSRTDMHRGQLVLVTATAASLSSSLYKASTLMNKLQSFTCSHSVRFLIGDPDVISWVQGQLPCYLQPLYPVPFPGYWYIGQGSVTLASSTLYQVPVPGHWFIGEGSGTLASPTINLVPCVGY